jgi:hypothetical protein
MFRYAYRGYWLINCKDRVECRAKDEESVKPPDWAGNTPVPQIIRWPVESDREGAQRLVDAVCDGNYTLLLEWTKTWSDKELGVAVYAKVLEQASHGQGVLPNVDLSDTPPTPRVEPVAVGLATKHPIKSWILPSGIRCSLTYMLWRDGTESYRMMLRDPMRRPLTQLALSSDMSRCSVIEDHPGRYWAQCIDRRPVARLIKRFRLDTMSAPWSPPQVSLPSTPSPRPQGSSHSAKSRS